MSQVQQEHLKSMLTSDLMTFKTFVEWYLFLTEMKVFILGNSEKISGKTLFRFGQKSGKPSFPLSEKENKRHQIERTIH